MQRQGQPKLAALKRKTPGEVDDRRCQRDPQSRVYQMTANYFERRLVRIRMTDVDVGETQRGEQDSAEHPSPDHRDCICRLCWRRIVNRDGLVGHHIIRSTCSRCCNRGQGWSLVARWDGYFAVLFDPSKWQSQQHFNSAFLMREKLE